MPKIAARGKGTVDPPHVPIAVIRKLLGLTLDQVVTELNRMDPARSVAWTAGTISAIENGHRGASPHLLVLLAAVYGIDPDKVTTSYHPRDRVVA